MTTAKRNASPQGMKAIKVANNTPDTVETSLGTLTLRDGFPDDATTQKAWAHWQANAADARAGRPISYGDLERRIGMELLPGVPLR